MAERPRWFADNIRLTAIAVMLFSAAFDGQFFTTLTWPGRAGDVFGFGLNAAGDVASEVFAYQFAKQQRESRRGSKKRKMSWILLLGEVVAWYFSTVFSWDTIRASRPTLELWLQWSAALFAPVMLAFLGVARALRDANLDAGKEKATEKEQPPTEPERAAFRCDECGQEFTSQQALAGHGNKHREERGK